jgi:DNA 3'-phosphatase
MRRIHSLVPLLVLALAACGDAPGEAPEPTDLGSISTGKADFAGLELDLGCLDKRGKGPRDTVVFKLRGNGAWRASIAQPHTASSKRAVARVHITDGDTELLTSSSKAPELAWEPATDAVVDYTLTIINRSHTKELCAVMTVEAVASEEPTLAIVPPTERRMFAQGWTPTPNANEKVTVAFFDADSTLRVTKSGRVTASDVDDVLLLPGVVTRLRQVQERGEVVVVVSNQGGVAAGHTTFERAEGALANTLGLLHEKGASIPYFDFAPERDEDRKPGIGMPTKFELAFENSFGVEVDWDTSYMVGDAGWKRTDTEPGGAQGNDFSNSDRGMAEALDIPFHHPRDFFGWAPLGVRNFHHHAQVSQFLEEHPDFGD